MHANAIDSEAVFQQRVEELGLKATFDKFKEFGWASHGNFAFAMASGPGGVVEDERFVSAVIRPLFGLGPEAPPPPQTAAVRRLFFESHALAVGELRQRTERTDSDLPRKVPQAERESRKDRLRTRLEPGVVVRRELEPANSLIDRFVQMCEDNTFTWVPWEEAPKRDQEITSQPGKRKWGPDSEGTVKERVVKDPVSADVSSALKISWALQRRGLAMDIAGVMSYEQHELIRAKLFEALTREVPDAQRYAPPDLADLRAADKEIWKKMSQACAKGIRPASAADPMPADTHVQNILDSVEVNMLLAPKVRTASSVSGTKRGRVEGDDSIGIEQARKRAKGQQPQQQPKGQGKKDYDKRGKGPKRTPLPKELQNGGVAALPDGTPICFGFNLGTCREKVNGNSCRRGLHVCCKRGCAARTPGGDPSHTSLDCTM